MADGPDTRAALLWEALGRPMGDDGLRLLTQATASMTATEFRAALRQVK